ncbi:hypothetical protein KKF34_12455 [Myxococcota bacterium]|nr:hypothetical protein [Myxococcota bacterium]MBU1381489.1 hypothetical protein [Myxococcota bacterium]MBU1497677.1 hypothetical protein [Myxococcota bacterium]
MSDRAPEESIEIQDELLPGVFTSFELPVSFIKRIQEIQFSLSRHLAPEVASKLYWVKPENYQIIIRFLGLIPCNFTEFSHDCLEKLLIKSGPVNSGPGRLSTIHDKHGLPKIITIAFDSEESQLELFIKNFEEMLYEGGYSGKIIHSFPHITLARVEGETPPFMGFIESFQCSIEPQSFTGCQTAVVSDNGCDHKILKICRIREEQTREQGFSLPDLVDSKFNIDIVSNEILTKFPSLSNFSYDISSMTDKWLDDNLVRAANAVFPGRPMEDSVVYEETMREKVELKSINENRQSSDIGRTANSDKVKSAESLDSIDVIPNKSDGTSQKDHKKFERDKNQGPTRKQAFGGRHHNKESHTNNGNDGNSGTSRNTGVLRPSRSGRQDFRKSVYPDTKKHSEHKNIGQTGDRNGKEKN